MGKGRRGVAGPARCIWAEKSKPSKRLTGVIQRNVHLKGPDMQDFDDFMGLVICWRCKRSWDWHCYILSRTICKSAKTRIGFSLLFRHEKYFGMKSILA